MIVTEEQLVKFMELYKQEFNIELDRTEAYRQAESLLYIVAYGHGLVDNDEKVGVLDLEPVEKL
jgi:hypothetical protein